MTKIRELKSIIVECQSFDSTSVGPDPIQWLQDQAKPGMILLAHATDGVIWGRVQPDGSFAYLPKSVHPQAALRAETLSMARLFQDDREIFIWSVREGEWCARLIQEHSGSDRDYFDEVQILWGTAVKATEDGFCHLIEGAEGMDHAPPLNASSDSWSDKHRARLHVRHYLEADDVGWQRIALSRLIGIDQHDYEEKE